MTQAPESQTRQTILIGIYADEAKAQHVVEQLVERSFPMDKLSVLGKAHASGDDVLGIYHAKEADRMKAWAAQGALWGGLWGLLAGAAGVFILPPIGAVLAAGPVATAIVGALEGATVAGAAMTGAAAITHLTTALHRLGIPEERLEHLHQAIAEGRCLVLLHGVALDVDRWRPMVAWSAEEVLELPYTGFRDVV